MVVGTGSRFARIGPQIVRQPGERRSQRLPSAAASAKPASTDAHKPRSLSSPKSPETKPAPWVMAAAPLVTPAQAHLRALSQITRLQVSNGLQATMFGWSAGLTVGVFGQTGVLSGCMLSLTACSGAIAALVWAKNRSALAAVLANHPSVFTAAGRVPTKPPLKS